MGRPGKGRGGRRTSSSLDLSRDRRPPVPARALLTRSALTLLVLLLALLAAVGGVSLGVSGMLAVALAAVVTACLAGGIAHDGAPASPRQAAVDAAWRTGAVTVAVLLVLSGSAVLAGGAVTALLAGG